MRHRTRSRNAGRPLHGAGSGGPLFPGLPTVTTRFALDVPAQRAAGRLFQDAARTTVAFADGDTVKAFVDLTGRAYTADADFTLRFLNGDWCFGASAGTAYGYISAAAYSSQAKLVLAARFTDRAGAGVYAIPLGMGGGEQSVGISGASDLPYFQEATESSNGGSRLTGTPQTLVAYYDTTGGGFLRQNGAYLVGPRATVSGANAGGLNVGNSFSGAGGGRKADLYRLFVGDAA